MLVALWLLACGNPIPEPDIEPEAAALTIVASGRAEGEVEPALLSQRTFGGLARRNGAIGLLRGEGPVLVLETGGSLAPRGKIAASDLDGRREKAHLIARSWESAGVDAIAIGPTDWALGRAAIDGLAQQYHLPILAANLECDEPYPGAIKVERGGLRVGIVGVTSGKVPGCSLERAGPAATAALEALGELDVKIALVPLMGAELEAWKKEGPGVDFLLDGSGGGVTGTSGRGWVLPLGVRGMQLGVYELFPVPGVSDWEPVDREQTLVADVERLEQRSIEAKAKVGTGETAVHEQRIQRQVDFYEQQAEQARAGLSAFREPGKPVRSMFRVVIRDLDPDVPEDAATAQDVQATLQRLGNAAGTGLVTAVPRVASKGSRYAGSDACTSCHADEAAQWATTPHARAWSSLVESGRASDHSCFSCHSTGANRPDGPGEPSQVSGLQDVQCEACHGPSAAHIQSPERRKPVRSPSVEVCTACHDGESDMGRFDWVRYRAKVVHTAVHATP